MDNFIKGMEITEDIESATLDNRATDSFYISWFGAAGATNSAAVQAKYNGGQLGVSVVVTGTPTWGTACVITVTPTNCTLQTGNPNVQIAIQGSNLGITFLADITPATSYIGSTVSYTVSIQGAPEAILYASGSIG